MITTMSTDKYIETMVNDRVRCTEALRALPDVEFLGSGGPMSVSAGKGFKAKRGHGRHEAVVVNAGHLGEVRDA